jgi:hypothetical protein
MMLGTKKMIDAIFWYTGLAVWVWIMFISLLASVVAVENRLMIKRSRAGNTFAEPPTSLLNIRSSKLNLK